MPKPSVLPVPVLAWPMMSWPPRATGSVIAWIGKGMVMPASASEATMSGWTSKSAKVSSGATAAAGSIGLWVGWVMGISRSARAPRGRELSGA